MIRFRQSTSETAGIHNTAGFNDDTRAFCSIPARHDLARRVDANCDGPVEVKRTAPVDGRFRICPDSMKNGIDTST